MGTLIPSQLGELAFAFIQLLGIIAVMSHIAWQVFIVFIPVGASCIWYHVFSVFLNNNKYELENFNFLRGT